MKSEYLPGGSGGVWRVREPGGEVRVHRPTGAWTPAVHELLRYLHEQGLDGIPIVHGLDDEGREILSYLPGESADPERDTVPDDALASAAAWMRRFHEAVSGFRPGRREWRQGVQDLGPDQIICHNDPGVSNWVLSGGDFAGMIDWDRAGPGTPIEDLAFACWSGVPLLREIPDGEAARRLRLIAASYGGVSPEQLLEAVDQRMDTIASRWRVGIERGDPGTLALRSSGVMQRHAERVEGYRRRRAGIRAAVRVWLG